ncbi:hypothetical protein L9F63_017416, partial [Diploptera punctata]
IEEKRYEVRYTDPLLLKVRVGLSKVGNVLSPLLEGISGLSKESLQKSYKNESYLLEILKSGGSVMWPLLDRMDALEADKVRLQAQLAEEREKKVTEMNTSVAVVQESTSSRDAATSPDPIHRTLQDDHPFREKLTRSTTSLIQQGKISIVSCNIGDSILVVWDEEHRNYTILQETSTRYFLHSDSLDVLGLRPSSDGSPRRLYSTGEVVDKEYCHAKKSENRYRVPKGTKFYRVKVRPLQKDSSLSRSHHHHHHHHHHQHQQQPQELTCSQDMEVADEESK